MYVCPKEETNQAKHISVAVNKWKYRLQYKKYFGGVTALSKSQVNFYVIVIVIIPLYDIMFCYSWPVHMNVRNL